MNYEIIKLIKKSPKKEAEFHRRQAEFLGQMECVFHVYDMDSPTLKILYPIRLTVQATSLRAILKNYGTLMKLWGWAQDNVSDSDMKARIIGVQTKMQTFSFFYGLQLAIAVLSHSDNLSSSLQRAGLCAVDAQKNAKLSVTVLRGIRSDGCKPPFDHGHSSCCEVGEAPSLPCCHKDAIKIFWG